MRLFRIIFALFFFIYPSSLYSATVLHPINKKLIEAGILDHIPKYHPEIARIPAETALALYKSNKALFVLISYHDKDLIPGAIHLTEGQVRKLDIRKLPIKKNQALVVY